MAEKDDAQLLRVNDLHPAPGAKTAKTRVGRGEGSKGKTSGRGTKGTKARYQVRPGFEGGQLPLYMRLPKLRGFRSPFHKQYQVINLDDLSRFFPKGGKVTAEDLVKRNAVRDGYPIKVLGDGDVTVKFELSGVKASKSALEKIKKAGGSISE
jgi:large subunit ribosomal protein L15